MKLQPRFYHVFLFSLSILLFSCSGSGAPEVIEVPVSNAKSAQEPTAAEEALKANIPADIKKLLATNTCLGCHKLDKKLVGPSYTEVAKRGYTADEIAALIVEPKPENWPDYTPMAPMAWVAEEDIAAIAQWIASIEVE
ncbi:MAG: hypothetical protein RL754_1040 [Bacteroidota bacterium]|jgi:cytochrome c551/c552